MPCFLRMFAMVVSQHAQQLLTPTKNQILMDQLIENSVGSDLNPFELAVALC